MTDNKDMALILNEILHCGEAMLRIADILRGTIEDAKDTVTSETDQPEAPVVQAEQTKPAVQQVKAPAVKTEQTEITFTDVRAALAKKARSSKAANDAVCELIRRYGAKKLSDVKPEQYADLLREAEVIRDA